MGRSDPSSSRSAAETAGRTAPAAGRPVLGDGAAACAGKHGRERWWWLPWRTGEETPALHAPEPRGQGHRSGARLGLDAVVRPAHLLWWLLAEARSIGGALSSAVNHCHPGTALPLRTDTPASPIRPGIRPRSGPDHCGRGMMLRAPNFRPMSAVETQKNKSLD